MLVMANLHVCSVVDTERNGYSETVALTPHSDSALQLFPAALQWTSPARRS
jgi:hypothetical protein